MSSFKIGEHKADALTAIGGMAVGAYAGNKFYKVAPNRFAFYTLKHGDKVPHITNKFIDYAQKVSEKDLMGHIDAHTSRRWIKRMLSIIRVRAEKARNNTVGDERWEFQKLYNLGMKYLTDRKSVPENDIGLAKRGANALVQGAKDVKRNTTIAGALLFGGLALLAKYGIERYQEYKDEQLKNAPKTITFED